MQPEPFDIEYFSAIIDLLHTQALALELTHDKFFDLQELAGNLSEPEQASIATHPLAQQMDNKLGQVQRVLKKIQV